jgi:phosphoglycolate phosphatase
MAIKAVLFDKDGTLIDVNRTWIPIYRHMLAAEFDADEAEVTKLLQKAGYDASNESFRAGSVLAGGTTRQLVNIWWPELNESLASAKVNRIDTHYAPVARQYLQPLLELSPVFDALKAKGLRLGVGTNDSVFSATAQMKALGVDHYFDAILGADSVTVPKPSGEMVKLYAERMQLACSEIAMVGDNTHDMEEAHHGGAMAIGVLSGNAKREHLEPLTDFILDDVAGLPAFFHASRHVL